MTRKRGYKVRRFGMISGILNFFVDSPLTPLVVGASILIGVLAVTFLPREEEPQIVVPMIDVMVEMPGSTAKEVENRITQHVEKLAWELPGVEYVYSISSPGRSLTIVRFLVGWDEEKAIVQLYQKLYANLDRLPPGASKPMLKPKSIDDVPVLALTFHGEGYDGHALRLIAAEVENEIKRIPDVSETTLIGGQRRQLRVELDSSKLSFYKLDPAYVVQNIREANQQVTAGSYPAVETEILVETGGFLRNAKEVGNVVVASHQGKSVFLRDVSKVIDGPETIDNYVLFGLGGQNIAEGAVPEESPAVTLAIAKRKGTNAVELVQTITDKLDILRDSFLPPDLKVTVTRDYGHTAEEKSNELLFHMGIAVVGVSLLIVVALGWREASVVAIAIPVTLALTLATFYLMDFTLNRVTLFALIFSIGILVDDPIVDVENVIRHFRLPENKGRPLKEVTVEAVNEVRSPLVLATLTVIAAVLPMAFVSGLMGPYMRPIPIGATAAMLFSMAVAFVVTPWAAYRTLRWHAKTNTKTGKTSTIEKEDWTTRIYRRVMEPMINRPILGMGFLVSITLLLLLTLSMIFVGAVKVKMLPYDNKSELQVIVDMDEGTPLECTTNVTKRLATQLSREPEVLNYQVYAGTAAPYNFNGLVRHYFLRGETNLADIQVNLIPKQERDLQSHDIAKRIRKKIQALAKECGAQIKVAEVPPGPPVLQTVVAEIYGPDYEEQVNIGNQVKKMFEQTPGVVDVDWYVEADQPKMIYRIDHEKAAKNNISAGHIAEVIRIAQKGITAGLLHVPRQNEDITINVRLPIHQRSHLTTMLTVPVCSAAKCIPLGELVNIVEDVGEKSIYRKNQLPVVYVTGDLAGEDESPIYALMKLNEKIESYIPEGRNQPMEVLNVVQPFSTVEPSLKWDGEWHITYEVFRDLGFAFAVVLVLIYILVVGWFKSFRTPFIIMAAIPFSLIGIIPGHYFMGAFFTATSMIGFIAGAGIVVRNSIILVDFIKLRVKQGMALKEAVVDAGAVRFRPMLLTAMAVVVGGSVILFDPIFQGLAISLMAGEIASLLLSRMAVPIIYYFGMRNNYRCGPEYAGKGQC